MSDGRCVEVNPRTWNDMADPYDWPTLREWLVWTLDLFLATYRNAVARRSLDRNRFAISDETAREAVLYVTDVVNEPCHEEEIRFLTRCRQVIPDSESAERALRILEQIYRDELG